MSILSRFKDIMSSNVNALLDKMEDPAKMVDQILRNLKDDLQEVKDETAGVMAEEKRAKRELDECTNEIEKMQGYAEKAVLAGNDPDARQFLVKKSQLVERQSALQQAYQVAQSNAAKMRQMHDKLVEEIAEMDAKRDAIKAKMAVAKTQEKMNQMGQSLAGSKADMSAFERMEEKAERMLDEANAKAELNMGSGEPSLEDLEKKYDGGSAVDDELAALKEKLGK